MYSENGGEKKRRRMKFLPEEDKKLIELVNEYGNSWHKISKLMEGRNVRQCRERWKHYLSSNRAKSPWTPEEDALLLKKYMELGPKWTKISKFFDDRTDIQIKSRWTKRFHGYIQLFQVHQIMTNKEANQPVIKREKVEEKNNILPIQEPPQPIQPPQQQEIEFNSRQINIKDDIKNKIMHENINDDGLCNIDAFCQDHPGFDELDLDKMDGYSDYFDFHENL